MDQMVIHWPILKELDFRFISCIRSFMVLSNGESLLMLTKDDCVYSYGKNEFGILGLGHRSPIHQPTEILELKQQNVLELKHGSFHILALTKRGNIFAWGQNGCGQLGIGSSKERCQPTLILLKDDQQQQFVAMECGAYHNVALTRNGQLYGWGENDYGQLGIGNNSRKMIPTLITTMVPFFVKQISCGESHSAALTDLGECYVWGSNFNGQLGNGNFDTQTKPEQVKLKFKTLFKGIACGSAQTLLLSKDGNVHVCGTIEQNNPQERSLPNTVYAGNRRFRSISANKTLLMAISEDDNYCYVWGELENEVQLSSNPFKTPLTSYDLALSYYSKHRCSSSLLLYQPNQRVEPVVEKLDRLFNEPLGSDVRFLIQDRTIYAHRWFLKASSSYYCRMFSERWQNQSSSILITEYSYPIYYAYLRYLYLDNIDMANLDELVELLTLADYHLEDELKDRCLDQLYYHCSVDNCCRLYELSIGLNLTKFKNRIASFVSNHSEDVFRSISFASMVDDGIRKQLRDDVNNIRFEIDF